MHIPLTQYNRNVWSVYHLKSWKQQKWHLWQVRVQEQGSALIKTSTSPAIRRAQGLLEPGAGGMLASTVGDKFYLSCWGARERSWGKLADCVAPVSLHKRLINSIGTRAPAPHFTGGGMGRVWDEGPLAQLKLKACDFWKQSCSLSNCRCLLRNCWRQ